MHEHRGGRPHLQCEDLELSDTFLHMSWQKTDGRTHMLKHNSIPGLATARWAPRRPSLLQSQTWCVHCGTGGGVALSLNATIPAAGARSRGQGAAASGSADARGTPVRHPCSAIGTIVFLCVCAVVGVCGGGGRIRHGRQDPSRWTSVTFCIRGFCRAYWLPCTPKKQIRNSKYSRKSV